MNPALAPQHRFACFDELPEGVCVLSENFVVVFWNRQLAAWTGVAPAAICGRDLREQFPALAGGEDAESLARAFRAAGAVELSEQFGRALLGGRGAEASAPLLRSTAVPCTGLDVCRYALLWVRDAAELEAAARRCRELEAQLAGLARELELERAHAEQQAVDLAKLAELFARTRA